MSTGLALNPEQQMRAGDSTTTALRVLGIEALHEAHKAAIRYDLADYNNKEESQKRIDENLDHQSLVRLVSSVVAGYVVEGRPPLRSLVLFAGALGNNPRLIRAFAERLAAKLFLGPKAVDTLWASLGLPAPGATS